MAIDSAIIDAVLACAPRRALDVGCGEGRLVHTLRRQNIDAVGVDACAPLIDSARAENRSTFYVHSYAEIAPNPTSVGTRFDAGIFNFALLEEEVGPILLAMKQLLSSSGTLFIQTVHPWAVRGQAPYRDGWRVETFSGFGSGLPEPMPWYYRTLSSWIALLSQEGYQVKDLREPVHPGTGEPLSLLFACAPAI